MPEAKVINGSDNIGSVITLTTDAFTIGSEKIDSAQILSVDLIAEENVLRTEGGKKSIVGAVGWGVAGTLALGPLGGLAGLVFGGRKRQKITSQTNICFALYLKDDRKYLISSDLSTFQTIKGMCFMSAQKNVEQSDDIHKICPKCNQLMKWDDTVCPSCDAPYHKPQFQEFRGGKTHPVDSDIALNASNHKRPVSIFLTCLLGAAFLITFLTLISEQRPLLALIIYIPLFIIITFSLIFINLRKNRKRTLGFSIATFVLVIGLVFSSIGFSNMERGNNVGEAISQKSDSDTLPLDSAATDEILTTSDIDYEEIGIKGLTVYVYTVLEELSDLAIIADIYKNGPFKEKAVFQIFFFNAKENAEHALTSSSLNYADLVALIARYNFNSNTGIDKLSYDIEEKAFEEAPSVKLEIYEGPLYTEDGAICYYRIKVSMTGLPTPIVEFSKDDSFGNLGKNKIQINLYDRNDSYTLTATATNSIGTASDSINLTWVEK